MTTQLKSVLKEALFASSEVVKNSRQPGDTQGEAVMKEALLAMAKLSRQARFADALVPVNRYQFWLLTRMASLLGFVELFVGVVLQFLGSNQYTGEGLCSTILGLQRDVDNDASISGQLGTKRDPRCGGYIFIAKDGKVCYVYTGESVDQKRRKRQHVTNFSKVDDPESEVSGFHDHMNDEPHHAVIFDITAVYRKLDPLWIHVQRALEAAFCILLQLCPDETTLSSSFGYDIFTEADLRFNQAVRQHIQERIALPEVIEIEGVNTLFPLRQPIALNKSKKEEERRLIDVYKHYEEKGENELNTPNIVALAMTLLAFYREGLMKRNPYTVPNWECRTQQAWSRDLRFRLAPQKARLTAKVRQTVLQTAFELITMYPSSGRQELADELVRTMKITGRISEAEVIEVKG